MGKNILAGIGVLTLVSIAASTVIACCGARAINKNLNKIMDDVAKEAAKAASETPTGTV